MKNLRHLLSSILLLLVPAACFSQSGASTDYYRHVIFDNSLTPDTYFYSKGLANGSSFLELKDERLPIETKTFLTPPSALRLQWQSQSNGGWEAEIHVVGFRNRLPEIEGHNLYFWCFAPQAISADDLPQIVLSDRGSGVEDFPPAFTKPLPLGKFAGNIPAGRWIQVRIPLSSFSTASVYEFRPSSIQNVVFHQGRADGVRHTLLIDEVSVNDDPPANTQISNSAPEEVQAKGYDRHIEIQWRPVNSPAVARYVIYRSLDGKDFRTDRNSASRHYIATPTFSASRGVTAHTRLPLPIGTIATLSLSNEASASTRELSDDELLTMLQEACFHYYWDGADPHSGMARENIPGDDRIVATGASGFGIMAL